MFNARDLDEIWRLSLKRTCIASVLLLVLLQACLPRGRDAEMAPAVIASTNPAEEGATRPALLPSPAVTPTLTMEQWLHPYTLEGLREREFKPGSLETREEAEKADSFTRYDITYRSEGLLISGTMQIPTQGKPPFPVIVMNHGYFNRTEYHPGDGTDRAAEYLNRHGYLTLSSDYRSWGSSEIGPSLYYSGLAIDVANLIMTAGSIQEADAERIGIWGHSMGGGVTLKVLALKTPVRAAVLYSTVSGADTDILARWGLGCIGDIDAGENQLGCNSSDIVPLDLPPELIKAYYESSLDAEALKATSPLYNLEFVTVPIQIHYGTDDGKTMAGTPPEWSRKLFEALHEAGKPVEIFAYEGEGHSFVGDSWVAFMERCGHFFDEYVKYGQ
jgi:dienelactone hydrolase